MPGSEEPVSTGRSQPPEGSARKDAFTRIFLGVVLLVGLTYTAFSMTPSSYGRVLAGILAPEAGPVLGVARPIRSDEWAILTPQVQAAVRNRFQRFNETSFYREDQRNYFMPPLRDWGLFFRPGSWLFFVTPPAAAFSAYWALFMCLFVSGYYLLFLELGVAPMVAGAGSLAIFFSGFSQFWWTTNGPILAGLPWVALVVLRPFGFIVKTLLLTWMFTAWAMAMPYVPLLLDTAWVIPVVVLAFRPRLALSRRELAAAGIAGLAASAILYGYFSDVVAIMRNTVYPGQRISPPGNVPIAVWASQLFPFLTFDISTYDTFNPEWNICEAGAVGTYLPFLTICLLRYSQLRDDRHRDIRRALSVLGAAFVLSTVWEVAPAPRWLGRILLWDHAGAQRLLFFSGVLLTIASLILWKRDLLEVSWRRAALFVLIGPVAGVALKPVVFGESRVDYHPDLWIVAIAAAAALALWAAPFRLRVPLLVALAGGINIYGFGRFNPLQSAVPIFQIPETPVMVALRQKVKASPEGYLVQPGFAGSVLNGLGFRSVSHTLVSPQMATFRKYFPAMNDSEFNQVFNRYASIDLSNVAVPRSILGDVIEVPIAPFLSGPRPVGK